MAMRLVVEDTDLGVDGVLAMSYEPVHLYLKKRIAEFEALNDGRVVIHGFWEKFTLSTQRKAKIDRSSVENFKYPAAVKASLDLYMPDLNEPEVKASYGNVNVVHEICSHGPHLPWLPWTRYAEFCLEIYSRYEMSEFMRYVGAKLRDSRLLQPVAELGPRWHQVSLRDFITAADSFEPLRGAELMFRVVLDNHRLFLWEVRFGVTKSGNPAAMPSKHRVLMSSLPSQQQVSQVLQQQVPEVCNTVSVTDNVLLWF